MRKQKVYLDTSVISGLDQRDDPQRMADALEFWDLVKADRFEIVISDLTRAELMRCQPDKLAILMDYLHEIHYSKISVDMEAKRLSFLYISQGGLPPKSFDDAMHIAIATVAECNAILSWNFKHMVNMRASAAVEAVNILNGYRTVRIMPPQMMLDMEE